MAIRTTITRVINSAMVGINTLCLPGTCRHTATNRQDYNVPRADDIIAAQVEYSQGALYVPATCQRPGRRCRRNAKRSPVWQQSLAGLPDRRGYWLALFGLRAPRDVTTAAVRKSGQKVDFP